MQQVSYTDAQYGIRDDFADSHSRFWKRLSEPGAWFTSTERIKIAAKSDFRPLLSASAAEADARLCHHHLPPRPYAIDMTPKTTVVNM